MRIRCNERNSLLSSEHGKKKNSAYLLGLLLGAAVLTVILMFGAQRLSITEDAKTLGYRSVLIDIDAQVKEILIFRRQGFTVETTRFICERSLEDLMNPRIRTRAIDCAVDESVLSTLFSTQEISDRVKQVVEELVSILLHVVIKDLVFFSKSSDKFLRGHGARLFLLSGNIME